MQKLNERITEIIRAWPLWSKAERKRMAKITEEILHYCRSGEGNAFIARWARENLKSVFSRES